MCMYLPPHFLPLKNNNNNKTEEVCYSYCEGKEEEDNSRLLSQLARSMEEVDISQRTLFPRVFQTDIHCSRHLTQYPRAFRTLFLFLLSVGEQVDIHSRLQLPFLFAKGTEGGRNKSTLPRRKALKLQKSSSLS